MATINATNPTMLDQIRRTDPNGAIANIVESMAQKTPFLEDATFIEGNLPTGHIFTHRSGLPSVAWRRFNEGVAGSKSKTDQITETCGLLSAMSKVDVKLADLNGNGPAFRASEDKAFIQAMNHEVESAFFYASSKTSPEKLAGLAPRLDSTTAAGGNQIMLHDGSASGSDQASIYLVCWSPETVFGMYPKGSKVGLEMKDMGEQLVDDGSGASKSFRAWVTDFNWSLGLCVKDSRYLVRIANVDTSALSTSGHALIDTMQRAIEEKLQDTSSGRCVFYVNRKIASYLRLQATDSVRNSTLTIDNVAGKPVTFLGGIPVRRTDALLNTESIIS